MEVLRRDLLLLLQAACAGPWSIISDHDDADHDDYDYYADYDYDDYYADHDDDEQLVYVYMYVYVYASNMQKFIWVDLKFIRNIYSLGTLPRKGNDDSFKMQLLQVGFELGAHTKSTHFRH